jgi:hypothetical protein
MDKINETTLVTPDDLDFIHSELSKDSTVHTLPELSRKLAFKKNASQLNQDVMKYDPFCRYEIGDLICKEYDEPLLVSSKGVEPFKGFVVLKVIDKIEYEGFGEMLEVDFTGGGTFRKHIEYMKKTNTKVLLPSAQEGKSLKPKCLKKEDDPRLNELPMTEKDLRTLEKNLTSALSKSKKFFHWKDYWQLTEKLVELPKTTVKKIEDNFREIQHSLSTHELVTEYFKVKPSQDGFDLHCLSLNYTLDKSHKKTFIFISPQEWGKWYLKELLDAHLKDIPLAKTMAKLPDLDLTIDTELSDGKGFPVKVYLSWREVLSGGLSLPKSVVRELSKSREYLFIDAETEEQYRVYFYPSRAIFLGLKDCFQKHAITQGASLSLDKVDAHIIKFSLKKAKKPLSVPTVDYEYKKDRFSLAAEEVQTSALPNKIIFLELATLKRILKLFDQSRKLDLRDLLILVFQHFGLEGEALSLHYQRAFHLADMLRHTSRSDVEKALLNSPEFFPSEKKKGLFLYQEMSPIEEEISPAKPKEAKPLAKAALAASKEEDDLPAIGIVGEIEAPDVILEETTRPEPEVEITQEKIEAPEHVTPEVTTLPPRAKAPGLKLQIDKPAKAKKEKEPKKKRRKMKVETEKAPRRRKGERKIIEERIELEESELEALFAVKSIEKDEFVEEKKAVVEEKPVEEKVAEFKPEESEETGAGIFGNILKSALSQKIEEGKAEKAQAQKEAKAKKGARKKRTRSSTKKAPS